MLVDIAPTSPPQDPPYQLVRDWWRHLDKEIDCASAEVRSQREALTLPESKDSHFLYSDQGELVP